MNYKKLPQLKNNNCQKLCDNGTCKHDCCGIVLCSNAEKHIINKKIKRENLNLDFVKGNLLPFDKKTLSCLYLKDNKCAIYDIRPAICRLFGAVKNLKCPYILEVPEECFTPQDMINNGFIEKETVLKHIL